jgi:hypothetical protein
MTPAEVAALKSQIDADLIGKADNVGIAFGEESFNAFVAAGHIQKRKFSLLGTTLFTEMLPAYGDGHFAFVDWELPIKTAKVGG